jgi:hypothetical protein
LRNVIPYVWIAAAGVVLALLGVSRPWSRRTGIVSDSVSGLDTEDGKYVAVLAFAAAVLLGLHLLLSRGKHVLTAATIAGALIALIAARELIEISSKVHDTGSDFVHGSVGWGVYATVLGGMAIALGSLLTLHELAKNRPVEQPLSPEPPGELNRQP